MSIDDYPQFRDETGQKMCPSGCLSMDTCVQVPAIVALASVSESLEVDASTPAFVAMMETLHGGHEPLQVRYHSKEALRQALSHSCLLAHENGL